MRYAGEPAEPSWAWTLQLPEKTIHRRAIQMPDLATIRAQVEAELSADDRFRGFKLAWPLRINSYSSRVEVSIDTMADGGELYLN